MGASILQKYYSLFNLWEAHKFQTADMQKNAASDEFFLSF